MNITVLITGINPEPWQSPDLGTRRAGNRWVPTSSTPAKQRAYQEALRESIGQAYPCPPQFAPGTLVMVNYVFRRRLDRYESQTGRNMTAHRADVTNVIKATEDCLTKPTINMQEKHPDWVWFLDNDVNVRTGSFDMSEGVDLDPLIMVSMTDEIILRADEESLAKVLALPRPEFPGNVLVFDLDKVEL